LETFAGFFCFDDQQAREGAHRGKEAGTLSHQVQLPWKDVDFKISRIT
jgi:hypothetical protein